MSRGGKDLKLRLNNLLALCYLAFFTVLGIGFVPTHVIWIIDNYTTFSKAVVTSMMTRVKNEPTFTFLTWLLPLIPATFIPFHIVNRIMKLLSFLASFSIIIAFLIPGEIASFNKMLRTNDAMGYMWHDTFLILIVWFAANVNKFPVLLGGPWVCVSFGCQTTSVTPLVLIIVALIGIVVILPTMHIFVNQNHELFLEGYTTDSYVGIVWQQAFKICWVQVYHLVCRDCYLTFKQYPITATFWILFGSAFVLIYVSAAYAFHLAYTSYMKIECMK